MKFYALITIVDENNKEITHFHKEEDYQYIMDISNTIVHKFNFGNYAISETKEMRNFIDDIKGGKL